VDAAVVARELADFAPALPRPDSAALASLREVRAAPRPVLHVHSQPVSTTWRWRGYPVLHNQWLDYAVPAFDYAGLRAALDDEREYRQLGEETVRLVRDAAAEAAALRQLGELGFEALPDNLFQYWSQPAGKPLYGLANEAA